MSRVRGALTTTRKLRRVTAGNVALTGDASGSADAVTGEGIALSFRQALLLAEAIAAENLAIYEAGHPAILRMPHLMSRAMLRMDAWPWMRERAMGVLSAPAATLCPLARLASRRAVARRFPASGRARAGVAAFGVKAKDIEKNKQGQLHRSVWSSSLAQLAPAQNQRLQGSARSGADRNPMEARAVCTPVTAPSS